MRKPAAVSLHEKMRCENTPVADTGVGCFAAMNRDQLSMNAATAKKSSGQESSDQL